MMVGERNDFHLMQPWPSHDGVSWKQILHYKESYVESGWVGLDKEHNVTQGYCGGLIQLKQDSIKIF